MKNRITGFGRSSVAVVVLLCMLLSAFAPAVMAISSHTPSEHNPSAGTPTGELNYVSLGDSMSNGYGLDDNYDHNGYYSYAENAYPNLFADWLADTKGVTVKHDQLALAGLRVEDLLFTLSVDYENADNIAFFDAVGLNSSAGEKSWDEEVTINYPTYGEVTKTVEDHYFMLFSSGDRYLYDSGIGRFDSHGTENWRPNGVINAAANYQNAVKNADVITLAIGNANFGVFLFQTALGIAGFDGFGTDDVEDYNAQAIIDRCQNEILKKAFTAIYKQVEANLDKVLPLLADYGINDTDLINNIKEFMLYVAMSYADSYASLIERIVELNPDAEIILVGNINTHTGLGAEMGGQPLAFGMEDVVGAIIVPANTYMASVATYLQASDPDKYSEAKFFYAEESKVECVVDVYKNNIYSPTNTTLRKRFVTSIIGANGEGMIWSLAKPLIDGMGLGLELVPVTYEEIVDYEAKLKDTEALTAYIFDAASDSAKMNKMLSCAIYLGFEKAVVASSNIDALDLSSFIMLFTDPDGLASALAPIMDAFENPEISDAAYNITYEVIAIALKTTLQEMLSEKINEYLYNTITSANPNATPDQIPTVNVEIEFTGADIKDILAGDTDAMTAVGERAVEAVCNELKDIFPAMVAEEICKGIDTIVSTVKTTVEDAFDNKAVFAITGAGYIAALAEAYNCDAADEEAIAYAFRLDALADYAVFQAYIIDAAKLIKLDTFIKGEEVVGNINGADADLITGANAAVNAAALTVEGIESFITYLAEQATLALTADGYIEALGADAADNIDISAKYYADATTGYATLIAYIDDVAGIPAGSTIVDGIGTSDDELIVVAKEGAKTTGTNDFAVGVIEGISTFITEIKEAIYTASGDIFQLDITGAGYIAKLGGDNDIAIAEAYYADATTGYAKLIAYIDEVAAASDISSYIPLNDIVTTLDENDLVNEAVDTAAILENEGTVIDAIKALLDAQVGGNAVEFISTTLEGYTAEIESLTGMFGLLIDMPEILATAATSSDKLVGLMHLFARNIIGDGLGAHPSEHGHEQIFNAIKDAYENNYKPGDYLYETIEKIIDLAYVKAYEYAEENNYVAKAVAAVNKAINAANKVKTEVANIAELSDELKAAADEELDAIIATLEKIKAAIVDGDVATVDGLVAFIESLEADLQIHLNGAQAILEIAKSDAIKYVTENWEEWKKEINDLVETIKAESVDYIVKMLSKYGPEIGEMAWDALLSTPEKIRDLIDFIHTYGSYVERVLNKYGTGVVTKIAEIAVAFGLDAVAKIVTEGEYILDAISALVEKYGDKAYDILFVYAGALGLENEAISALNSVLDLINGEIANLELILAKLQNAADKLGEELIDLAGAAQKKIENKLAAINLEIERITALINSLRTKAEAMLEEIAVIADAATVALKAVAELAEAIKSGSEEEIVAAAEAVGVALNNVKIAAESAEKLVKYTTLFIERFDEIVIKVAKGFALIAEAIDEVADYVEKLGDRFNDRIEGFEEVSASLVKLARALSAKVNQLSIELVDFATEMPEKIQNIADSINAVYESATSAEYEFDPDNSYYVAIGDKTTSAGAQSYASVLAGKLGLGKYSFTDLTGSDIGFNIEDALAVINANKKVIEKADLITFNYNRATAYAYLDMAASGGFDWEKVFGAEIAAGIEEAIDAIAEAVKAPLNNVLSSFNGVMSAEEIVAIVEYYVYTQVARMVTIHQVVDEIRAIAPDALIVIVGAYNEFDGVIFEAAGESIEIAQYLEPVVAVGNASSFIAALLNENTIFVDTNGIETQIQANNATDIKLSNNIVGQIMGLQSNLVPSSDGNVEIAERIYDAINPTGHKHVYGYRCDSTCDICGAVRDVIHTYSNACDADCNICGYEREPGKHIYSAICDVDCDICGFERDDAAAHSFSAWKVERQPTLNVMGLESRTCTNEGCEVKETRTIAIIVAEPTEEGVSAGLVVGITIPSILVLAAGGFSGYWFVYKKKTFKDLKNVFVKLLAKIKK